MNIRKISTIALSNRDFSSLEEKLLEAVSWLEIAAAEGAELTVLPELLNRYCGDGYGNPRAIPFERLIMDDWQTECRPLLQAVKHLKLWTTVPVLHRSDGKIFNSFFLIAPDGEPVWRYDKICPTPNEIKNGLTPGQPSTYNWNKLTLGGAICFDTCFPEKLEQQARDGVQLFLVPSLWPGGSQLNHLCKIRSTRVALAYPAWSRIIDIDGLDIVAGGYRHETLRFGFGAPVYTASLNFDRVALYGNHNQEQMIALRQKYGSKIQLEYDQGNCLWFLDSCDPDLHEKALLDEFDLQPASEYFTQIASASIAS